MMRLRISPFLVFIVLTWIVNGAAKAESHEEDLFEADQAYIKEHYTKYEYQIPMRDGVKLFTAVYAPKDDSIAYPILLKRTPYSCRPYGASNYPGVTFRANEVLRRRTLHFCLPGCAGGGMRPRASSSMYAPIFNENEARTTSTRAPTLMTRLIGS